MRRIIIILAMVILAIVGFFYYDHITTKRDEVSRQNFDLVMTDKMRQLYEQAQDRTKPVNIDIHDSRLTGDYKTLSEFLLKYWIKNIDTRNAYLNQLATAKWNHFLDVKRLDADRKQNYQETEKMMITVRQAMLNYQKQNTANKNDALAQLKTLDLKQDLKQPLQAKLEENSGLDPENSLILNELQILAKAEAMFEMLKKYEWEAQKNQILFKNDAQVKQFNQLFQDVLKLNAKINDQKEQNAEVLEQAL
ncbi:hypothetical protein [Acinetobacter piscicola]|uniref:hypothetical protein n=1 Tax=Acinetobacter piscicola TaxID=2006115 RepID=UPI000B7F0EB0|nr:hypothetical protein [Acinetobacter piscicola]